VLHAAFEEYYWRWFVFGELRRAMPWVVALLLANLGFTLHLIIVIHIYVPSWTMTLLCSLGVFVGGSVWGWIYQKSGSLVGPWVSHMLIDFVLMWIGYDLCRGMLS
jgi:membrane protease YdiL (CAAX protease family)